MVNSMRLYDNAGYGVKISKRQYFEIFYYDSKRRASPHDKALQYTDDRASSATMLKVAMRIGMMLIANFGDEERDIVL